MSNPSATGGRPLERFFSALRQRLMPRTSLQEKWKEAVLSVTPIVVLVQLLCFFVVPLPTDALAGFTLGSILLVFGMGLFNLGTDLAMIPIGEGVGQTITRSRNVRLVLVVGFLVGLLVTVAEPDLTVLATQVSAIPKWPMILSVALGVGIFLMLALLRILKGIRLWILLLSGYAVVLALSFFVPRSFLAVAFDAGGVTTGPMTVPFILALGVGVAATRSDNAAQRDSFGLVALASIGPVISVMVLGIIYRAADSEASAIALAEAINSMVLFRHFSGEIPHYLLEVLLSMAPVLLLFLVFQFLSLRLKGTALLRVINGLIYAYVGLVLFLTGVNVGFMPVGHFVGKALAGSELRWLLVPIGMVIGWFAVSAEPAVQVLCNQVYEMTAGAVRKQALQLSLSVGVAVSIGLSMLRVITGIPILYFLIPGYVIALVLMIFSPPVFTAIAFDSGGVASGPMTATFLLPLAIGACEATGGNITADAFGVVALVAMTPLITIQLLGVSYRIRQRKAERLQQMEAEEIIEL